MPLLLPAPVKEFILPKVERALFEDAFDEIELLSFPVSSSPFDLLQTDYRGGARAGNLVQYNNQTVRILAYLISTSKCRLIGRYVFWNVDRP